MRLLCLSLRGLSEEDAAIWIDIVGNGWRLHPKALPLQIVGLAMMGALIAQSSLPDRLWMPPWTCLLLVWAAVIPLALHFRRVQLHAGNYTLWRVLLLGWRALHAVAGGILFALLYGNLSLEWRLPLLIMVVVFTYGLAFYAVEDWGLAMVGGLPVVTCVIGALLAQGGGPDRFIALLLVAACLNGWLAGRSISVRLFEAARTRRRNAVLVDELAWKVEQVTRAKAEAEHANREKSEFFAAASHDLRQPLYSLQLLADHLRRQLQAASHVEIADKLRAALNSMRQLFERMFDVARLEAQKVAHEPRPVPVAELFAALDHEFAHACARRGLSWSFEAGDAWVQADPVLALRMLRNLLENAVRYTTQGGVHLRARQRGAQVVLQVWDSGSGIARTDRLRVFDDYFQVHNEARRAQDGLGLGLGVVRRLAALTGACITLRSRTGRGSCFGLGFPLAAAVSQAHAPAPDESGLSGQGACVLVLEDEPAVREAVIAVLQADGWLAIGADSARQAVEEAARQDAWPQAVISDWRLGGQTGLQAIAALRYEFGDELPAILVTGDLDPRVADEARVEGIAVMHKPLDRLQLLQALRDAFPRTHEGMPHGTPAAAG
ncbi:MAG: hybrid sensor histidine kinase/response regulator [Aquabacterium sp.]|nr:MAG: hybrid sensor histidine kinase/response regulator [Aquabacterium sp.]